MIFKEEIKKLADLARMEVSDSEQEKLADEMDAILGYVSQVKEVVSGIASPDQGEVPREAGGGVNIMRADENPTEAETSNQELIAEFPEKEGDYLKVKKIL